jgi:phage terminase large subunit-like protein
MSRTTPGDLPSLDQYRYWKPDAQAKALRLLQQSENSKWRPFFCGNPKCDGKPHDKWDFNHARADQRPPNWRGDWLTLLLSGGRGSGKTRAGSEITQRVTEKVPQIILIGATTGALREIMIEGRSGILATSAPGNRPEWEPSKKKLTWPNGCVGLCFTAEEPDRLRGPESGFIWADEPAHYDYVEDVWSNMQFGLRVVAEIPPKIIATSTPLPIKWMRELVKAEDTVVRRVSTYENLDNLAPVFKKLILDKYEGTRLGRQELHGELLEDVEGALWNWDMFQWIEEAPELQRLIVAIDPAGTANKRSDETGIIVVGVGYDRNVYVLHDFSGKYSPEGWASKANREYEEDAADAIVYENTYGKDMVTFTLENAGYKGARLIGVDSRRGKAIRAEPVVALYEKRRVFHVGKQGDLSELEDELTSWVPTGRMPSPNRLDALVHGITEVAKFANPASFADPTTLLQRYGHLGVVSPLGAP